MAVSAPLSIVIAAWLTGPLFGINLVLVICVIFKLMPYLHYTTTRLLMLYTILIAMICLAHAALLFALLVKLALAPAELTRIFLPILLVILAIYAVNMSLSQAIMVWRIYATSRHNKPLTFIFVASLIISLSLNIVVVQQSSHLQTNYFLDGSTNIFNNGLVHWTIAAWSASLVVQAIGSTLIIWKTWSVPVEVHNSGRSKLSRIIYSTFLVIVESGCLLLVVELAALISTVTTADSSSATIFAVLLGQLSAFVPLTIILREAIKAKHDLKKNLVNATSALLVNGIPRSEIQHVRTSFSMLPGDVTRSTRVVIQQSEHKHSDIVDEESVLDHLTISSMQKRLG